MKYRSPIWKLIWLVLAGWVLFSAYAYHSDGVFYYWPMKIAVAIIVVIAILSSVDEGIKPEAKKTHWFMFALAIILIPIISTLVLVSSIGLPL